MRRWLAVWLMMLTCAAGRAEGQAARDTITFRVADGYLLQATLGVPALGEEAVPAVVLVHSAGADRAEWDGFFDRLLAEGYVVLSYDTRGHGGSTPLPAEYPRQKLAEDPDMTPRDLKAAILVVAGFDVVDPARVAVVGSSMGADLACVASAWQEAKTAVALSPGEERVRRLAGRDTIALKSVYFVASEGDSGGVHSVKALLSVTDEPRRVDIIDGSNAKGAAMFRDAGDLQSRVLRWLRETL